MLLAKDEVLIKEWCYANRKSLSENVESTLTITNKRVVSSMRSELWIQQHEMPLDCIKGISSMRAKNSLAGAIAFLALAMVFLILGCVMIAQEIISGGIVFILLMVFFVVMGIIQIVFRKGVFSLVISTKGKEGEPVVAGAASRNFIKKNANFFIVQVDLTVADDIIETIGALIIESKSNN